MNLERDDKILLKSANGFEELYIHLRAEENRMYSDEEVVWLPDIGEDHIHKKEWELRKSSCKKLLRYLRRKRRPLKILEVGCGNGWLSYQLSQMPYANVIGLDINLPELQQAARVFGAIPNLHFVHGDLYSGLAAIEKFDMIIFAASIQYFASFSDVMGTALKRLNEKGEVHILDSHFYAETEIEEAQQRSREYFHSKGFDEMNDFYFHHSLKELDEFNCTIVYNPRSAINRILNNKNPFYWVCIQK